MKVVFDCDIIIIVLRLSIAAMKGDFTDLNSQDDIIFNHSNNPLTTPKQPSRGKLKEHIYTNASNISNAEPFLTKELSSQLPNTRTTNKKSISTRDTGPSPEEKMLNHRERSKQRFTGAPKQSVPNSRPQQVKTQTFIKNQIQQISLHSPTKLLSINSRSSQQNQMMINQANISAVQVKETREVVEIKNLSGEHNKIKNNNVKKWESIRKVQSVDQEKLGKHNNINDHKELNIINQQKLPKIPTKKFDNLEKIYGVNQKKVEPRRTGLGESPLKPGRPSNSDREVRRLKLDRAKEILSGKVTTVWIYAISTAIKEDLRDRIYQVYKGLLDDENIVPFVKQAWEIEPFLQLPNTYFKIVTNLQNADKALGYKINVKVVEYYIYNDEGENGLSRALEYKNWSKKVKGIYSDLQKIIQKTEEEIDDNIQIFRFNNGLEASVKQAKFPSFLKLSGKDKTEATLYRGNLYGAIKIDQKDKEGAYSNFMSLVREKYGQIEKQRQNIIDYSKLKHLQLIKSREQAQKVIKFYVRESFYYPILNSMLRTLKSTEEFKPCVLPFNQTYHSVKLFYSEYVNSKNRKLPAMQLYRGTRLKIRDFNSLQPNVFIEMFGFMSTSKSLDSAKKFTDKDGYIFVIHVPEREMDAKWDKYDHGYVDINANKLATSEFVKEEEVLFNALNTYRVRSVERKGPYIYIHLEYGAIFDLLSKAKQALSADQKDVLINYQYCTRMMGDIEDQGDVHLLSSQFDEAKDYYNEKISKNEADAKNYYKLANVQKECGEIDEAQRNGQISLQLMTDKMDLNDRETCLKVFSIHSKNAQINIQKEDYLNADEELTQGIQMLDQNDVYNKAKKIRERGEVKFKKGEIKQAEKDFDLSEKIFLEIEKHGENRKWDVQKKYFFSILTLWCSEHTKDQLESQRDKQLSDIDILEKEISDMRQNIEDQLVKVNQSLKDVALYVENKDKYEYCVKRGRALLLNLQERETNDPAIKARLKVMEATIQDYLDLAESQKLLNDAIQLVESQTPFDPTVGQYATILAKLQKKELQKFTSPEAGMRLDPNKKLEYNPTEHKAIYGRCRNNFQKAINVMLYNNKTKDSPEVIGLKNQIGELDFTANNFQSCQEIIREVRDSAVSVQHSEISKTCLLLSKIAFARGQLKLTFKTLDESDDVLKKVIIKSPDNPKYQSIYQKNDTYLEIVLIRSKVFHRQMNHDLSLKQLDSLEEKVMLKMDSYESHSLLASVYEQIAQVYASTGQRKFQDYFEKAISLRQKQMGEYNIFNAVSYCNYAKYLMLLNELKPAAESLGKAVQIFACLSNDHPINWVVHFANGIFYQQKNNFGEASKLFKTCLSMAVEKFDSSHITIKKVRLRIAKALIKLDKIDESFLELQQLQQQTDSELNQSRVKIDMSEEIDDEKITLQKIILNELKNVISKEENNLRFSMIEVQKYKAKYDSLRASFRLDNNEKE